MFTGTYNDFGKVADEVVISKHEDEMKKHAFSFDSILECVSAEHD